MQKHTEKSVFSMSSNSMLELWSMSMGSERPVSWEQTEQLYVSVTYQGTREYLFAVALNVHVGQWQQYTNTPMLPGKLEPNTLQTSWAGLTQHLMICCSALGSARFSYLPLHILQALSSHLEHSLLLLKPKCWGNRLGEGEAWVTGTSSSR